MSNDISMSKMKLNRGMDRIRKYIQKKKNQSYRLIFVQKEKIIWGITEKLVPGCYSLTR